MPRPRLTQRRERLTVHIPENLMVKLRLELLSEIENRVPHGKISEAFTSAIEIWLSERGIEND